MSEMVLPGIGMQMEEERVSLTFSCESEDDAETLFNLIADALSAGELRIGSVVIPPVRLHKEED